MSRRTTSPDSNAFKAATTYVKYVGPGNITAFVSDNGRKWPTVKKPSLAPRRDHFDSTTLHALNPIALPHGILLIYYVKGPLSLGAALFDKNQPNKVIWRSEKPFYSTYEKVAPTSVHRTGRSVVISFETSSGAAIRITIPLEKIMASRLPAGAPAGPLLEKHIHINPIIRPRPEHSWESQATFNPAAVYLNGRIHLLYRAIGDDGLSVLGYASGADGLHFDERLEHPAYVPTKPFETFKGFAPAFSFSYMSGGGYGGCEDPRLTKVNGRLYMTYTAFDGHEPPRVAIASIAVEDFLAKRWRWRGPFLISPPGEQHKNWVIFPERIQGKQAVLHSISPEIKIDYFDSLEELDGSKYIKSSYQANGRRDSWDSHVRGVGPPPIRTNDGWLILYHAIDHRDPHRYKLGAMLLDINDPTKILYRSAGPVLEPDAIYENNGYKAGVVYACGAVVIDETLFVYYGGSDTVSCVATHSLSALVNELKNS